MLVKSYIHSTRTYVVCDMTEGWLEPPSAHIYEAGFDIALGKHNYVHCVDFLMLASWLAPLILP